MKKFNKKFNNGKKNQNTTSTEVKNDNNSLQRPYRLLGLKKARIDVPNSAIFAGTKKYQDEKGNFVLEAKAWTKEGSQKVVATFSTPTKEATKAAFEEWYEAWKGDPAYSYDGYEAPDGFRGSLKRFLDEAERGGNLHGCLLATVSYVNITIREVVKK